MLGPERQSDSLRLQEQDLEVRAPHVPTPRASLLRISPGVERGLGRVEDRQDLETGRVRTDRVEDRWRKWLAGRGSRRVPSREGGGSNRSPPPPGSMALGQGSCRGQVEQELALTSMVLSSDPTLLRRPRFPAPTSKEPSVRAATPSLHPAGLQSWAPSLGPPGDRHPYSLSPIEEGVVGRRRGGEGGAKGGRNGRGGEVVQEK